MLIPARNPPVEDLFAVRSELKNQRRAGSRYGRPAYSDLLRCTRTSDRARSALPKLDRYPTAMRGSRVVRLARSMRQGYIAASSKGPLGPRSDLTIECL
jgi:hypothetical protein